MCQIVMKIVNISKGGCANSCPHERKERTVREWITEGIEDERMESQKNEFEEEWHELRFSQFYGDDDEVIASFVQDEMDDEAFYYISKELGADDDLLWADSIDDAKQQIEEMLIEHWKDEIEYLEDRLKEFQEKK